MLSDDEKEKIMRKVGILANYETIVELINEAESAVLAKLRQGAELPEPDTDEPASNYFGKPCYYTEETLQQYGDSRDQAGYLRGLAQQPEPDEAGHIGFQEWWDSVADEYEVNDFKKMRRAWNASLEYAPAAQPHELNCTCGNTWEINADGSHELVHVAPAAADKESK